MNSSARAIEHGTVLLGKYRVDEIIGRGGMGVVVKAVHLGLDEQVAIKMLRDDVAIADETIARFVREAQAAVKLKSEHIARITDVGMFDDGKPYMVMEYLDGEDIGQLLAEHGRLSPSLAIDIVIQACEALAEAHSLGIVHRDIKPTNLFVTSRPDGSVLLKILDFGISKAPSGPDLYLTQTWSVLGTPAYMSPEQMRSAHDVDARTDIWSLGAVLYEALEGHLPFQADSFSEMCVMVAIDRPSPTIATPRALVPIITRCLAKSVDDRYASVAELARDLAHHAREPEAAHILVDRMVRMLGRAARRPPVPGMPQAMPLEAAALARLPAVVDEAIDGAIDGAIDEAIDEALDDARDGGLAEASPDDADPATLRGARSQPSPGPRAPGGQSVIGVPLGPVAPTIAHGPAPHAVRATPAAGIAVPAMAASPEYPAAAGSSLAGEQPALPSVPTYHKRVPLPVPLHDDARFPRPGLQLPRGAPRISSTHVIARPRRGWLLAVATAVIAVVAVVLVVAATWTSPVAEPSELDDAAAAAHGKPVTGEPPPMPTVAPAP